MMTFRGASAPRYRWAPERIFSKRQETVFISKVFIMISPEPVHSTCRQEIIAPSNPCTAGGYLSGKMRRKRIIIMYRARGEETGNRMPDPGHADGEGI